MATSIWGSNGGVAATPAATNRIPTDISSGGAPNHHTLQQLADLGASIGVTTQALGSINTNTTITWSSGSYVTATIAGALTFTFAGAPSSGQGFQGVLVLTNGGSATVTWPGYVTWAGATAPTLRTSGVDVLRFYTSNGGTDWYGELAQDEQEFAASAITSGTLDAARLPAATETAQGAVELATTAEALTGTDTTRAVTAAGVKAVADTKAASSHTHAASDITSGTLDAARLPAATTSASGAVELATVAECQAGTDTTRATTPEGVAAAIAALGLAQPLTTPRFTGQTSVPSAASSGEVKAYVRQLGKAFAAAYRGEVGDHVLLLPSLTHPLVRAQWNTISVGISTKNVASTYIAGTTTASTHTTFGALLSVNYATAASANAQGGRTSTLTLSSTDGYMTWGITSLPDASYGSGATGAKIQLGVARTGISADAARLSVLGSVLEYNTNEGDTNWMAVVRTAGGVQTPVDTGLAFSATACYFWIVFVPRSGSSTYFYINNLTAGTEGSATVAHVSGATNMGETNLITTLTTTARNIRIGDVSTLIGGAI